MKCYICSSTRHVDDHHVDCQYGEVSPDTVPLCRRCHRTYHDLGIEWFDDELLDRAIEVENMRRKIFGEPLMKREDIVRSDYWYKKHGVTRVRPGSEIRVGPVTALVKPGIEPLCGWAWLEENRGKVYPEQGMEVLHNGKVLLALPAKPIRRGFIRAVMTMARSVDKHLAERSAA